MPKSITTHSAPANVSNAVGELPTVHVVTGYRDDPRKALPPGHNLHGLAYLALLHQDEWSFEMWRRFWHELVPQWPHTGRSRLPIATLARTYAKLNHAGYSLAAIDEAMPEGYPAETLRSKRTGLRAATRRLVADDIPPLNSQATEPRFTFTLAGADGSERDCQLAAEAVFPRVYSHEPPDVAHGGLNLLGLERAEAGARPLPVVDANALRTALASTA